MKFVHWASMGGHPSTASHRTAVCYCVY